jgi:phosphomannomutase
MDDTLVSRRPLEYRCPGDSHPIDRVTHLARLAEFYPACLACPHRADALGLTPLKRRERRELERRAPGTPVFDSEELSLPAGEFDSRSVTRLATAVAVELGSPSTAGSPPAVLVGHDGHWTTADFVPAACRALDRAGCQAIEVGAVSSPCMARAAARAGAVAALWMGRSEEHVRTIRLWQGAGRPCSSPGTLDAIADGFQRDLPRPTRRGGALGRLAPTSDYLATFNGLYHALRPLVFVLDTRCEPVLHSWQQLNAGGACRALLPEQDLARGELEIGQSALERRLQAIARRVVAAGAHFGLWIDGSGEACRLVDERGQCVAPERLLAVLARFVCREHPGAAIALEPATSAQLRVRLAEFDARLAPGEATRERMHERMHASGALLGGGASGRYWYAGPPPLADALFTLSLLLAILSQSDAPLSEVLDAAWQAG